MVFLQKHVYYNRPKRGQEFWKENAVKIESLWTYTVSVKSLISRLFAAIELK